MSSWKTFILLTVIFSYGDAIPRRHKRQSDAPCVLDQQETRTTVDCFEGTLEDISGDLLGDSAGDVTILRMVTSTVPSIPAGSFQNMPALSAITIMASGLSDITAESFTGIPNLVRLNLSRNEIDNLNTPLFTEIPELRRLNLTGNKINSLQPDSFEGLTRLQILDLSNNLIENLPPGLFRKCPNIGTIDLSGNQLKVLTTRAFYNLPSLSSVDLSRNKIANLPGKLFDNVPNFSRLMLTKNVLRGINPEAFAQPLTKLSTLRVDNNEIIYVDINALQVKLPALTKCSFVPNPWSCSCFQDFRNWLKTKNVDFANPLFFEGKRPVCVVMREIASQTYEENESLQTFVGCTKPTDAVAMTMRRAFRAQLNKYNQARALV